ncbi:hypothetical protein [Curtobacterium sp. Leaf261]|uniref:hypothetical protein n=1 Tax=Curtobacterium sp. Leaf261 TaxID=1736311 RepID=UPI0006FF8F80|nr:hypothetical protein [Curtobacterium sp. Leaf261]KQO62970.1 hypothetical protein ASF23_08730 [Curtobacterium sp. Leaf261]
MSAPSSDIHPTTAPVVTGVHLVGSVNSPDAESTFRAVAEHVGPLAHRIPDGEVGERFYWIQFQNFRFDATAGLERVGEPGFMIRDLFDSRQLRIIEGVDAASIVLPDLGYASAALESYATFRELRDAGVIAPGTRFQVSLPTPIGVVGAFFRAEDRAAFEPVYERAMFAELDRIVDGIPHGDLAIQWDNAVEFAILESSRVRTSPIESWFGDPLIGIVERAHRQIGAVPAGVEVGMHLCYGDVEEQHFVQPDDTGTLAAVLAAVLDGAPRTIDFVHLPVPIERSDAAYFAPLADVDVPEETELVLGLVHHEDGLPGALARVEAARTALDRFGIATECGFGRGPADRTAPLLELHRQVAGAVDAEVA